MTIRFYIVDDPSDIVRYILSSGNTLEIYARIRFCSFYMSHVFLYKTVRYNSHKNATTRNVSPQKSIIPLSKNIATDRTSQSTAYTANIWVLSTRKLNRCSWLLKRSFSSEYCQSKSFFIAEYYEFIMIIN